MSIIDRCIASAVAIGAITGGIIGAKVVLHHRFGWSVLGMMVGAFVGWMLAAATAIFVAVCIGVAAGDPLFKPRKK